MRPAIVDPWELGKLAPNPRYTGATRGEIAGYVQHLFGLWYGAPEADAGQCLHWAHAACCVLRLCGLRSVMQAGDMSWPINRAAAFPLATHFSYQWSPYTPQSQARIAARAMPEVHVWCALPDQQEIVDFSTFSFRTQAEQRHGLTWVDPEPPEYLWTKANALPPLVIYRPRMEAIVYVSKFLNQNPIPKT